MSKQTQSIMQYVKTRYVPGMHIKIISVNQKRSYIPANIVGTVVFVDTCGRVHVSIEVSTVKKVVTLYPDKDLFVEIEGGC